MLRRSAPALLCLAVLLIAARLSAASSSFRVVEEATRLSPRGDRSELSLAFENPSGRAFAARAAVELLDPRGRARALEERDVTVADGRGALQLSLPFSLASVAGNERGELPWFRLRYRVAPADGGAAAEGVVSLSEITPDLFELHVSSPFYAFEGMRLRARVYASNPASRRPAKGVRLEGEAALDDERGTKLRASAVTDGDGYALLDFEPPPSLSGADEIKLSVRARLGGLVQEAEDTWDVEQMADIVVGTDKPIYQPGQSLRVRALFFDVLARRALAGVGAVLRIRDPNDAVVYEAPLRASRLGVAAADWAIPEGTRLGPYMAHVEVEEGTHRGGFGGIGFSVSRYELPTFAVAVEPDRRFYLPGEDAEVTVRADYLFGKPVPRGRVRVVREASREWDYSKQKWEVEEEETYEGEADDAGSFRARLPLGEAHRQLGEEHRDEDGGRFRDLEYAAYVTDPSTNRTEQRRFALRVTREPIHVYVVKPGRDAQAAGFPLEFYLSTYYADGTPAPCEVSVARLAGADGGGPARPLQAVKTNRFGLAKVELPALAPAEAGDPHLSFTARDAGGRAGRAVEEFDLEERTVVRVSTDKSLYRAGEPLRVELTSNRAEGVLALDVMQGLRLVHTQPVRLSGGRASALIPFREEFRDEVSVVATALPSAGDEADGEVARGSRAVLFPNRRELRLDLRLDREEYRPGHEARADIRVRDADGREVETALGVVVTDRAVVERARSTAEFGGRPAGGFEGYVRQRLGEGESVAGVTRRDLAHLDASKPLPDGLGLVAEVLLNREAPISFQTASGAFSRDLDGLFGAFLQEQLKPVRDALAAGYERRGEYPRDAAALRRILSEAGVDFDALRDPWGRPYAPSFSVERDTDVFELVTASADERSATADDFVALRLTWPYFRPTGLAVERAFRQFFERTGRPARDRRELRDELLREGVDLDELRDRWGRPYDVRFEASGRDVAVKLRSGGPDGRLAEEGAGALDDFTVWQSSFSYFLSAERRIRQALDAASTSGGRFPRNEAEFDAALRSAGVGPEVLLDPWGRPHRVAFRRHEWVSGQTSVVTYPSGDPAPAGQGEPGAARHLLYSATLSSLGADGLPDTRDDFQVTSFSGAVELKRSPKGLTPRPFASAAAAAGELRGVVTDPQGAVVPGAVVRAAHRQSGAAREVKTDDEGHFVFADLPAGTYDLHVQSPGFLNLTLTDLTVGASHVTEVQAVLAVGGTVETVMVTGAAEATVEHSTATVSEIVGLPVLGRGRVEADFITKSGAARTPRLREYFPETLVWQPLVETDGAGRATVRFKLADNITTWKMAVVGSTLDGGLGLAEADVRAFQPFFVEHDPPRVLTAGDEISLPVVLRNYLARPQEVGLEFKPEPWFTLLGPARKQARVEPNSDARETFDFRAVAPVREGRQRVTANGSDESDAVEKTVSVHPDGEEVTQAASEVFGAAGALETFFPADAVGGTARAELKIYPDLRAHVVEGVEAIMRRPYGCGEQTISSTYPSLLVLRLHRARGEGGELPPEALRAERYVREGYERLLGYRTSAGGFAYWKDQPPDAALTAYALKFLSDARAVVAVDEEVVEGARRWLLGTAGADGSWGPPDRGAAQGTERLTAVITRVLAEAAAGPLREGAGAEAARDAGGRPPEGGEAARASASLKRSLDFLALRAEASGDPYLLASFILAADARGAHAEAAARAARRLLALRHDEGGQTFWELKGETPFHGWGRAGRIEATALAVRALAARAGDLPPAPEGGSLVGRALAHLLEQKDALGVWYSTQATVNVLDALDAVSNSRADRPREGAARPAGFTAEIYVNGRHATNVTLLGDASALAPAGLDLTPFLISPGRNRVEVRRAAGAPEASAQLVSSHYVPWDSPAASPAGAKKGSAPSLKVSFDRTEVAPGQAVTCRVEVTGGAGRGMLLAEVGLPPGVEVDRATLESARADAAAGVDSYEVLPDRLVLYLWPTYGRPARLAFAFRPRYALRAVTAPSQVYDYYNPEARAVVRPTRFVVR